MNDFFKSIVNDSNVQTTRRTFDFGDFLMNIANKTLDSCGCKVRVYKTEKMYEGYSLYYKGYLPREEAESISLLVASEAGVRAEKVKLISE